MSSVESIDRFSAVASILVMFFQYREMESTGETMKDEEMRARDSWLMIYRLERWLTQDISALIFGDARGLSRGLSPPSFLLNYQRIPYRIPFSGEAIIHSLRMILHHSTIHKCLGSAD